MADFIQNFAGANNLVFPWKAPIVLAKSHNRLDTLVSVQCNNLTES